MALALDAELGVRMGRSQLSVNSSVLLLGSLPGRTSVRLGRQLELEWSSGARDAMDNQNDDELIFFHKSECNDGSCPAPNRLQVIFANALVCTLHTLSALSRAAAPDRASNFPCKNTQ